MTSVISGSSTFAIWASLFALAALGFYVDKTAIGKRISGVAVVMLSAIVISNVRLLPMAAPAYEQVFNYLVPVAIPLLLFKADLKRIIPETGGMMLVFCFGAVGTSIGTVIGASFLPLGEWKAEIAGAMAATYIGGSMNFVAVGNMLEIPEAILVSGIAADNVAGSLFLVILALAPSSLIIRRWFPSEIADRADIEEPKTSQATVGIPIDLTHIASSFALSLAICSVGTIMSETLGVERFAILFITAISVIIANLFPGAMARLNGHMESGMLLMYVFFAVIGLAADLRALIESALWVFAFAILILSSHVLFTLIGSRLFKIDLAEAIIASNACASGPTTAAALAASKGWHQLVVPGVLCGTLGYVVASFIGILVASMLG